MFCERLPRKGTSHKYQNDKNHTKTTKTKKMTKTPSNHLNKCCDEINKCDIFSKPTKKCPSKMKYNPFLKKMR